VIIGVALFDGAEELDWAGPWEVLAAWSKKWPDDGVRVLTLAREAGTITCAKGLQVVPEETWETAPALDVLVYPGGGGTRQELADEAVLDWIRGLAGSGTVVASVCTGSLVLAAAGSSTASPRRRTGSRSNCCRRWAARSRCDRTTASSTTAT